MTTEDAKAYLASREIPQLFESLMTGLMFYRPDDHIGYLEECLRKIREEGVDKVRWNLFITSSQSKMPLPPITPDGRPRSQQGNKEKSFITEVPKSLDEARGTPLPAIGQTTVTVPVKGQIDLPNCPIILAMGGPGSGKATQAAKLVARYEGYVHLSMGDLLRQRILDKGSSNDKWGALGQIMSQGDLAPDDMTTDLIAEQVKANMNAKGLIFEGYPRTTEQLQEFLNLVGRVDLAFILDCEEQYLMQRILARGKDEGKADDNASAAAQRLLFFKDKTLPVIKALDDMGKLAVLDGDRDADEIFFNLAQVVDNVFYSGATTGGQTPRTTSTSQKTASFSTSAYPQGVMLTRDYIPSEYLIPPPGYGHNWEPKDKGGNAVASVKSQKSGIAASFIMDGGSDNNVNIAYKGQEGSTDSVGKGGASLPSVPEGVNAGEGPDGRPIVYAGGPGEYQIGPDGRSIIDRDGRPITHAGAPGEYQIGPDGCSIIGRDGRPIIGPNGRPIMGPDGRLITGPDGRPIIHAGAPGDYNEGGYSGLATEDEAFPYGGVSTGNIPRAGSYQSYGNVAGAGLRKKSSVPHGRGVIPLSEHYLDRDEGLAVCPRSPDSFVSVGNIAGEVRRKSSVPGGVPEIPYTSHLILTEDKGRNVSELGVSNAPSPFQSAEIFDGSPVQPGQAGGGATQVSEPAKDGGPTPDKVPSILSVGNVAGAPVAKKSSVPIGVPGESPVNIQRESAASIGGDPGFIADLGGPPSSTQVIEAAGGGLGQGMHDNDLGMNVSAMPSLADDVLPNAPSDPVVPDEQPQPLGHDNETGADISAMPSEISPMPENTSGNAGNIPLPTIAGIDLDASDPDYDNIHVIPPTAVTSQTGDGTADAPAFGDLNETS